jgi:hypothetical protein
MEMTLARKIRALSDFQRGRSKNKATKSRPQKYEMGA